MRRLHRLKGNLYVLTHLIFICGLSEYNVSLFHLVNHAFFKALLFLSAGSIIHALSGEQDMRRFGQLLKSLPYTYGMTSVGVFALCGFPFLSGFYSKDLILELSFSKYATESIFSYWLGVLSAMLTAFYSFRIMHHTFWGKSSLSFKYYISKIHELKNNMAFALILLAFGSLFSGYFLKDAFVGIGTAYWGSSIFKHSTNSVCYDMELKRAQITVNHLSVVWQMHMLNIINCLII